MFRCIPITAEVADRFRAGYDDRGNTLRRMVDPAGRFPCRVCLCNAVPGEAMLLGSYNLPKPQGIYWTPSPIFVHERKCEAFDAADTVPDIIRNSLVSVRAYDADGMCLYDLGHVAEGPEIDPSLTRAMTDERTSFVNVHTAKPGCLLCRVEKA